MTDHLGLRAAAADAQRTALTRQATAYLRNRANLITQLGDATTDLTDWDPAQLAALRTAALQLAAAADAALAR